ncbi:MAG: hypothetical protein QXI60_06600 [Thermofilaceae archaeon]
MAQACICGFRKDAPAPLIVPDGNSLVVIAAGAVVVMVVAGDVAVLVGAVTVIIDVGVSEEVEVAIVWV